MKNQLIKRTVCNCNSHYIVRLRDILIDHERISFSIPHAKDLKRHLWAVSLLTARTCLKLHVRYNASVYHYLRHLSRTGTRVYTKRPAFTQDLSLFTPYKSRNTVLFLGGKHSPKSTYSNTPSPFVGSSARIGSKWSVSASFSEYIQIHRIRFVCSYICLFERENPLKETSSLI